MDSRERIENRTTPFPVVNFTSEPVPEWEAAITGVALSAIVLFTIAGNILVIMSVFTYRPLRIPPNYFIASLAATDIAVALLVLPFSAIDCMKGRWILGATFCKVWMALNVLCCSASILHLCAIAMDRYWAIKDPVAYGEKRTVRRILTAIGIIWCLSAVLSSSLLYGEDESSKSIDEISVCLLKSHNNSVVSAIIVLFYLTLSVTTIMYARLFITVRRRLKNKSPVIWMTSAETHSQGNTTTSGIQSLSDGGEETDADFRLNQRIPEKVTLEGQRHVGRGGELHFRESSRDLSKSKPAHDGSKSDEMSASGDGAVETSGMGSEISRSGGYNSSLEEEIHPGSLNEGRDHEVGSRDEAGYGSKIPTASEAVEKLSPKGLPSWGHPSVREFIEEKQRVSQSKERRLARTLGLIMGGFVVCWLPFFIMYLVIVVCNNCHLSLRFRNFITWLGYINSTLNPIIYTIFNTEFRRAFRKILHL